MALADGRIAKAGGRVVKNVAGYDLMKLLIGSYGSLGVITSANFKLFPSPQQTLTLICEFGYKADSDRCVKITCGRGYELNDNGTCEKIEVKRPTAKREEPKPQRQQSDRAKPEATPAKPQASGQIFCDQGGCRPVQKGCRLYVPPATAPVAGTPGVAGGAQREVCN